MNFLVKKFFVLYFIGLVISITPGFALKTGDTLNYNDNEMILSDLDKKTNEIDTLSNKLNDSAMTVNESVRFVKNNAWKFWKYGQVKDHIILIITESNEVNDIADQITVILKDIETDSNILKHSLNEIKSNDSNKDIEFLKEVQNRSNTIFDINDPINFKNGDIVQYKSKKGNNKYLKYVEIDNKTSYVILQNSANKKIALSQEFFNKTATLKISPKTSHPKIINTIHDLQLEKIDDTKNLAQKKKQAAQKLNQTAYKLELTGMIFLGIGATFAVIGANLVVLGLMFAPCLVVGGIFCAIGGTCMCISVPLVIVGANYEVGSDIMVIKADIDIQNANAIESDLCESLNSFPYAADMNITTPSGVSVNGTLNGTDFDNNNLTYTIVEQPKHGNLNTSLNGCFIYTPNNNFTGQDSFKYKVNDGNVDSNVARVNITVLSTTTKIVMNNVKGKVGDRLNITAKLQDSNGNGIANETVIFKINNKVIGKVKTNENGVAILNYLLRDKGKFILSGIFAGNNIYTTTNSTNLIIIESKK